MGRFFLGLPLGFFSAIIEAAELSLNVSFDEQILSLSPETDEVIDITDPVLGGSEKKRSKRHRWRWWLNATTFCPFSKRYLSE